MVTKAYGSPRPRQAARGHQHRAPTTQPTRRVDRDRLRRPSKAIAGSLIGGLAETQEMLDFCAERVIAADLEHALPSARKF